MLVKSYKVVDEKRFEVFIEEITQAPGRALVKINYGAVCKADLRYYLAKRDRRTLDLKYPLSLIHEAIGMVLRDNSGKFSPGDYVTLVPNIALESCSDCRCKREDLNENYCPHALFASSNTDGFSKEIVSYPLSNLVKIASCEKKYVFSELISVALASIRRTNIDGGARVAVIGDGILGYITCAVLRAKYNCEIFALGKHADKLARFEMCDGVYEPAEFVKISGCFDTAFECVGGIGAQSAINSLIDLISVGGEIVLMGVSEQSVAIETRRILEKGLTLKGSTRSSVSDFIEAVKLMGLKDFSSNIGTLIIEETVIGNISDYYRVFEAEASSVLLGKRILKFL